MHNPRALAMPDSAFESSPLLIALLLTLTAVTAPASSQADSPFLRTTSGDNTGAIQPALELGPTHGHGRARLQCHSGTGH